jgi:hypothetical protein
MSGCYVDFEDYVSIGFIVIQLIFKIKIKKSDITSQLYKSLKSLLI